MPLRPHKQFIATIAAIAIAVTGLSAAPARAGDDDVGRAVAALLGLAIVGAVIADQRRDDKARVHVDRTYNHGHIHRQPIHKPRPLPPRVNRKLLPQQCLHSFRTTGGKSARIFGAGCLNQTYAHVRSLPRECVRHLNSRSGKRHGYSARCLSGHGYQLARR